MRVQDARIVEETNLRAAVLNYAARGLTPARQRDGLGVHDVKWSHSNFNTHIATAAANGKVILYDLNRAGVELARLHEHTRQVHKLAFNPHQGYLLLSASQDASVRLWDLREMRKEVMTCPSRDVYQGLSDGIRDVQWSPTDAVEFAFGTNNGTIQRWDYRHNKGPKQKITGHDQRLCTSIDWHPDGKHLLSAGVDKTVKVWDFSISGRRQKPTFVLTTPFPVYNAKWRPPYWSDTHFEKGVYQATQIATSYDTVHHAIHIWDLRRPHLPFREIDKFESNPSDMLWHSRDLLWTVGREGIFQQNDVHRAHKVVDRRNLQAFAVSPTGELAAAVQKRRRRRREYSPDGFEEEKHDSPEKSSLRSSADDSLDDSFLSSSVKKSHVPSRTTSHRSARSFGSTPPAESAPKVMFLTDSLAMLNEAFQPNQVALRGTLPGVTNAQVFSYLAQKYKTIPLPDPPTLESFINLKHVFDQNAQYAERAASYRLAETWRIAGLAVAVASRHRAEMHREHRRLQQGSSPVSSLSNSPPKIEAPVVKQKPAFVDVEQRRHSVHALLGIGANKLQPPTSTAASTSTSNLPTPLARPVKSDESSDSTITAPALPDLDRDEQITLPPPAAEPLTEKKSPANPPLRRPHAHALPPTFTNPQWYHSPQDLDERRAMIGSWRAPPREPLRLETSCTRGPSVDVTPPFERHGSGESFTMFSASTESPRGASMPSSFASGMSQSHNMQSVPEEWSQAPNTASFGKPRPGLGPVAEHSPSEEEVVGSLHFSPTTVPISQERNRPAIESAGAVRDGSGLPPEYSSREQAVLDIANLQRNNQLLRHDSSESEALTSSIGDIPGSPAEYSYEMEASGTIVPGMYEDVRSPQGVKLLSARQHASVRPSSGHRATNGNNLLLADYQAMDVDAEQGSAFSVIGMLQSTLAFYTDSTSDAQACAVLLLLMAPLLPQTHSSNLSDTDTAEALAHYSEAISALGLTPTQVDTILSTQLKQLLATGIDPFQAESILDTYHAQLLSMSLFNPAASLRRLAYPAFPGVYEQGLKGTQLGLLCLSCKSPINNPKDKMCCETCKRAQAPCPICWGRYPEFSSITTTKKSKKLRSSLKEVGDGTRRSPILSPVVPSGIKSSDDEPSPSVPENPAPRAMLWTWCSLCGHGGHTNCLSTWFSDALSDGACPTEGCLCDCVDGRRRDLKIKDTLAKKAEKDRTKSVRKGDDWKVNESKAVSAVRTSLPSGEAAAAEGREARLTAEATYAGLSKRDDGKRVRVVAPRGTR